MASITLRLPALHAGQKRIVAGAKRYTVTCCGRRFGKSVLGIDRIIHTALQGLPVAWFAPNYKYLTPVWRKVKELLKAITRTVSEQEKRLELVTGGEIEFWTLDGPDPALGRKYALVVVDEAAIASDLQRLWTRCIKPTLLDLGGAAWFLSTPRGYNYFHTLALFGQDETLPDWAFFTAPTTANPTIPNVAEWVENERKTTPSDTFQQEFLAEFIRGGGAVFRKIDDEATRAVGQAARVDDHQYVMGLDFGRSHDYTAVSVIDVTTSEQVYLDRYTGIEFVQQQQRIKALADAFAPSIMVCESNSFGQANIEALQRMDLPILPFTTTQGTKAKLVDDLTLAFEQRTLKILPDPIQKGELMAYEGTQSKNSLMSYSAPQGMHDDTVMALMLAYSAASAPQTQMVKIGWQR